MPRRTTLLAAAALALFLLEASAQTAPGNTTTPGTPPPAGRQTCAKPVYPPESLRYEETGVVTISFLIGVDGLVKDAKIVKTSGHARLDVAARDALGKCQFKPATVDGKPEEAWVSVQYVWSLK